MTGKIMKLINVKSIVTIALTGICCAFFKRQNIRGTVFNDFHNGYRVLFRNAE